MANQDLSTAKAAEKLLTAMLSRSAGRLQDRKCGIITRIIRSYQKYEKYILMQKYDK